MNAVCFLKYFTKLVDSSKPIENASSVLLTVELISLRFASKIIYSSINCFALKNNAPVFFSYLVRTEKGFKFVAERIRLIKTGDFENDIKINTEKWSRMLEKVIREYPDQWFWVHRRWKTQKS